MGLRTSTHQRETILAKLSELKWSPASPAKIPAPVEWTIAALGGLHASNLVECVGLAKLSDQYDLVGLQLRSGERSFLLADEVLFVQVLVQDGVEQPVPAAVGQAAVES